ncbi:MAG: nitrous oxide reductase accessory protein NosL [Thermoanaerobaculia bacterium]
MKTVLPAWVVTAVLVAGCGGGAAGGPPEILYGQDICDRCRMVISEERHAAALRHDGRAYRFDDTGCLRGFLESAPDSAEGAAWVHDESSAWLGVEEAWFVKDPEGRTPMGSGIHAFASAEAAAKGGGRHDRAPRRWSEVDGPDNGGGR